MNEKIVIFSENTHSFLKNEIYYASMKFDKVYLISPFNIELQEICKKYDNIIYMFYSKNQLRKHISKNIYKLFTHKSFKEFNLARKENLLTKDHLSTMLVYYGMESLLKDFLNKKIRIINNKSTKWVILSAWYSSNAFASAQVKKKYPFIKVISLAHSYEVDKLKNKYTKLLFRYDYHNYLDKVSFISKNVLKNFITEIAEPMGLKKRNLEVRYLGTQKLIKKLNPIVPSETIRIVSCSHVVPIKRVDFIFESLNSLKGQQVEWTHIGDGKELPKLIENVEKNKNKNLKVNLLGKKTNEDIHELLSSKTFDMFINLSIAEGIPVTLMESLAYGIPIIATDVGGNSEIVNENCGILLSANPKLEEVLQAVKNMKSFNDKNPLLIRKSSESFFYENFNADKLRPHFYEDLKL